MAAVDAPVEPRGWRASKAAPYGLVPALAMVALTAVDGADGGITSGALPFLQEEFGFGDFAAGVIPTMSLVAGVLLVLPAGYLADRANRTRLLSIIVLSWSFVTLGSVVAVSFGMFLATRTVLGAAGAMDNPSVSSLLADWYAPSARARAYGYQRVSLAVGIALGTAIGGIVGEALGWRWAFGVIIVPGLLVSLLVAKQPEPPRGGLDELEAMPVEPEVLLPMAPAPTTLGERFQLALADAREVIRIPTIRHVMVGLGVYAWTLGATVFWLPTFLGRVHDIGEGRAATLAAAVVGLGALLGAVVGGELADRRHDTTRPVRMTMLVVAMGLGLGLFMLAVAVSVLALQLVLLLVAFLFIGSIAAVFPAVIADVVPVERRGAGFSVFQFLIMSGQALGPLTIGGISDLSGSLRFAFLAMGPLAVLGTLQSLRGRAHYVADMRAAQAR